VGKHIVISREGGDFSIDLIFAGLVRKFGKENVIDYPVRVKHRQGRPELIGDDEKDYGAERRSLCYVENCEDMREWSLSEIATEKIDCVWLDETDESFIHWIKLAGANLQIREVNKTVVIAGHDNFRGDPVNVKTRFGNSLITMFVDDWQSQYNKYNFMNLTNLSCNFDHLWDSSKREVYQQNKIYDLCFIGYNSNPVRRMIIDHVEKNWGHLNNCIIFEDIQDKFDRFIRHDEMFKLMGQSKVCLNLPGASTGGRALRYYEIPYVGSCMSTMRIPAHLLHPFENLKSCLEFSSITELDMNIDFALRKSTNGKSNYAIIANEGYNHCLLHHTVDARLNYIIEIMRNKVKTYEYRLRSYYFSGYRGQ